MRHSRQRTFEVPIHVDLNGHTYDVELLVYADYEPEDPSVGILLDSWEPEEFDIIQYRHEGDESYTPYGGHNPKFEEKLKMVVQEYWDANDDTIWEIINGQH